MNLKEILLEVGVIEKIKTTLRSKEVHPGAYLGGGHWAMAPPLGRQDCKIE